MKHIKILFAIVLLGLMATSCSETLFDGLASEGEGEKCVLSLPIECMLPEEKVVTRSGRTEAEEKRLNDLQILVFSASTGKLKGYRSITHNSSASKSDETYLDQDGNAKEVTVKTTTGSSYVYAVANCSTTDYKITVPSDQKDYIDESTGIFKFDEDKAQDGDYDFNLTHLQKLGFSRVSGEIGINDGYFLMCGMIEVDASEGVPDAVNIEKKGSTVSIESGNNLIMLRRMVSKVKFDVKETYTSGNTTYKFNLQSYDIYNIPTRGNLVQGETASETADYESNVFERMTNQKPDQQTSSYNGFIVYLPENIQAAKNTVTDMHQREANETDLDKNGDHIFTNAPDGGTFVVLHGTYEETVNGSLVKSGSTSYTIHLGDFSTDVNDYNNKRNYYYTYTVHVQGVNKFIAETKVEGDDNPGAEGFVFEYGKGRSYTLDSHYEYCVMRFYQDEIKSLINQGTGYAFYVNAMEKDPNTGEYTGKMVESDRKVVVTDKVSGNLNNVDTDWIRFLKGGSYSKTADHGGPDPGYTTLCIKNGYTDTSVKNVGLSIVDLLKTLYNHADDTDYSFWTEGLDSDGNYVDYVCYLDENFYTGITWDKFTNCKSRNFFIADDVYESPDKRSVYATRAYDIYQKSIQTFYNRDKASELTAYGCEEIDETFSSSNPLDADFGSDSDHTYEYIYKQGNRTNEVWNGRANTIYDIFQNSDGSIGNNKSWPTVSHMYQACLKRNRDLNHDGNITEDELRWYTPTVSQYAGLWIGEDAIEEEAALFTGKTSNKDEMHYYTSTYNKRVFWSEEGMSAGNRHWKNNPAYRMRCIRTLPSGENINGSTTYTGATDVPDKFYVVDKTISKSSPYSSYAIDLSRVDSTCTQTQTAELAYHHEREDANKVANYFYVAEYSLYWETYRNNAKYKSSSVYGETNNITCAGEESKYKGWRIPNQRELSMMYIAKIVDNDSDFPLDTSTGTTCRTHFSATYRLTWRAYTDLSMDPGASDSYFVRCIKVGK